MIDDLLILDVFSHRLFSDFSMDRQGPSVCGRLCRNLKGRINIDHILLFRRPGLWTQYGHPSRSVRRFGVNLKAGFGGVLNHIALASSRPYSMAYQGGEDHFDERSIT